MVTLNHFHAYLLLSSSSLSYIYLLCRRGSLDAFEVFIDNTKQMDIIAYGGLDSSKNIDIMDIQLFMQVRDGHEKDLFYANNSLKWLPGPDIGKWHNHSVNNMTLGNIAEYSSDHRSIDKEVHSKNTMRWFSNYANDYFTNHNYTLFPNNTFYPIIWFQNKTITGNIWHSNKYTPRSHLFSSYHIEAYSEVRLPDKVDWDAKFLLNYGDHKYNIAIEDYSSYDHQERFVAYGNGRYGGNLNSW